jgi:two-component system sensor kinase FixL
VVGSCRTDRHLFFRILRIQEAIGKAVADRIAQDRSLDTRNENAAALIRVTDTGSELAPDVADKLFLPFQTTKSAGMGIGLSICRSIIEAHGGQ